MADDYFKDSADDSWVNSADDSWIKDGDSILAESGAYAITGAGVTLKTNFISVDSGAYTLVGFDADLTFPKTLIAESGSYILSGSDIGFGVSIETGWIALRDQGPWAFTEQPDKPKYNEGDRIKAHDEPIWNMDKTGVKITNIHHPWCGYWTKDYTAPSSSSPSPSVVGLFAAGSGSQGKLGNGSTDNISGFAIVIVGEWSVCAAGASHSAAIRNDGTLWTTGYNLYGQLGQGDNTARDEFTQVGTGTNWASVACGNHNTIAIKTDGTAWGCGYNISGALGQGDNINKNSFVQIGVATNWASVACGNDHTILLNSSGLMYGTGLNTEGQLGINDLVNKNVLTAENTGTAWSKITCGSTHTLAIKSDLTLWGCGTTQEGQLGIGTTAKEPIFISITSGTWGWIAAGQFSSMCIKTDGTLWVTGGNYEGELGLGDQVLRNYWSQVGSSSSWEKSFTRYQTTLVLDTNGIGWGCGYVWPDVFGTGNVSDNELSLIAIDDTDAWETFSTQASGHFIGIKQ